MDSALSRLRADLPGVRFSHGTFKLRPRKRNDDICDGFFVYGCECEGCLRRSQGVKQVRQPWDVAA